MIKKFSEKEGKKIMNITWLNKTWSWLFFTILMYIFFYLTFVDNFNTKITNSFTNGKKNPFTRCENNHVEMEIFGTVFMYCRRFSQKITHFSCKKREYLGECSFMVGGLFITPPPPDPPKLYFSCKRHDNFFT